MLCVYFFFLVEKWESIKFKMDCSINLKNLTTGVWTMFFTICLSVRPFICLSIRWPVYASVSLYAQHYTLALGTQHLLGPSKTNCGSGESQCRRNSATLHVDLSFCGLLSSLGYQKVGKASKKDPWATTKGDTFVPDCGHSSSLHSHLWKSWWLLQQRVACSAGTHLHITTSAPLYSFTFCSGFTFCSPWNVFLSLLHFFCGDLCLWLSCNASTTMLIPANKLELKEEDLCRAICSIRSYKLQSHPAYLKDSGFGRGRKKAFHFQWNPSCCGKNMKKRKTPGPEKQPPPPPPNNACEIFHSTMMMMTTRFGYNMHA